MCARRIHAIAYCAALTKLTLVWRYSLMIDLHSRPHLPHWVATSRRSRRSRMLQAPSVTASRICVSVIPLQRHTYMGIPPAGQDGDKVRRMRIIVKQLSMLFAFHQLPGINSTAATPIIELNISHPAALWSRQAPSILGSGPARSRWRRDGPPQSEGRRLTNLNLT